MKATGDIGAVEEKTAIEAAFRKWCQDSQHIDIELEPVMHLGMRTCLVRLSQLLLLPRPYWRQQFTLLVMIEPGQFVSPQTLRPVRDNSPGLVAAAVPVPFWYPARPLASAVASKETMRRALLVVLYPPAPAGLPSASSSIFPG